MDASEREYEIDMEVLAIQEERALYRAGVLSQVVQEFLDEPSWDEIPMGMEGSV